MIRILRRGAVAPRSRRASKVVRLALAGVALAGIGAAATSAAWNDSAFFKATTTTATVDLRASADGTTYTAADTSTAAVDLSAGLTNLVPGSTVTKTLYLWNAGSSKLVLAWGNKPASVIGATCDSVTYGTLPSTALPGDSAGGAASKTTVTVTYTVLSTADQTTCANKSASLSVSVVGTTTP
jgi:hypothetical protein